MEIDPDSAQYKIRRLHLRSISISPGADRTVKDHGEIIDQDGRAARMIMSLTADDKGRVYM